MVALETTLRAPRNFENPGRFDYVGHLARRGIYVTGFVWDRALIRRLPGRMSGLRARLERWRARLGKAIAATVALPEGPILRALVVGDEGEIEDDLRAAFTRAGVVHVLSVSGLHVGLVAAIAFAIARWLLARNTRLLLATDVDRLAGVVSLVPVALYTAHGATGAASAPGPSARPTRSSPGPRPPRRPGYGAGADAGPPRSRRTRSRRREPPSRHRAAAGPSGQPRRASYGPAAGSLPDQEGKVAS